MTGLNNFESLLFSLLILGVFSFFCGLFITIMVSDDARRRRASAVVAVVVFVTLLLLWHFDPFPPVTH
jgi:uncharacterized membrane protein YoaK (UPF0700 family)